MFSFIFTIIILLIQRHQVNLQSTGVQYGYQTHQVILHKITQ